MAGIIPAGPERPRLALCGAIILPMEVKVWSLTTRREKLLKIGAEMVSLGKCATFQLAEVAVPGNLFREILRRLDEMGSRSPARYRRELGIMLVGGKGASG